MARGHDTTTAEHQPPSTSITKPAPPTLLAAFPKQVAVALPKFAEVVGRAWLASHGIIDSEISSQHLSFVRAGSGCAVMDERSRNGTYVDGERVAPGESMRLEDGSVLRVGRTILVYREAPPRAEPQPNIGKLVGPWGLSSVRRTLGQLRSHDVRNVLVTGETGSGKELVAEAVAAAFRRRERYAVVNMAAVPIGVFEAQLFGWVRGAYSGAVDAGKGVFASHDGGAVFLDEIGELPLDVQAKLLRLLDNGEVQPVGGTRPLRVDCRIVAATNRDLPALVAAGKFRADLLARFERTIDVPALRDRAEDVFAILAAIATREKVGSGGLDVAKAEVEAVERVVLHDWPTNVRGLRKMLLELETPGVLALGCVERSLGAGVKTPGAGAVLSVEAIERAVAEAGGNEAAAARKLGVTRGRLRRMRKKAEGR